MKFVAAFVAVHFALIACAAIESAGGEVVEFVACPTDLVDCGHVYLCAAPANNALGHVEICINDDDDPEALASAESIYGACVPTPRHQGLCAWHCAGGGGCNALGDGMHTACFCPSSAVNKE